jgi:VacB/RNase II family 3'-5' exoribonuclease
MAALKHNHRFTKGVTMTNSNDTQHRFILQKIARQAMIDRGLWPEFSPNALAELDGIHGPAIQAGGAMRDLRTLPWCSIDNDDSRDLDQLSVAERMTDGTVKVLIAIADVDSLVKKQSAIDEHARHNTTSVYTAARIFPLLPEKLSTDFTSLNFESDRGAVIIEMVFANDGSQQTSDLYLAIVRNHAKLAYNGVGDWLEGKGPKPRGIAAIAGIEETIRLQDRIAQKLKTLRHLNGALNLETIEVRPVFDGEALKGLEAERGTRAKEIIEDFMIAANGVTAGFKSAGAVFDKSKTR